MTFQTEKRINDLIREKENMATEIWQLKRDLDKVNTSQKVSDDFDGEGSNQLDNFDPENPRILRRKIGMSTYTYIHHIYLTAYIVRNHVNNNVHCLLCSDDLESQVRDLQEVNETTVNNLIRSEKEREELKTESENLRHGGGYRDQVRGHANHFAVLRNTYD